MQSDNKEIKLSKTLLELKFMKKSKERVQKEKEAAEGNQMYLNEVTHEMRKNGNIVFVETSITNCRDLIEGRLSFGGMNPEIEKIMQNDYEKKLEESEKQKEKEISDVEMAKSYSTLTNTMANKFQKKRKRNTQKQ